MASRQIDIEEKALSGGRATGSERECTGRKGKGNGMEWNGLGGNSLSPTMQ